METGAPSHAPVPLARWAYRLPHASSTIALTIVAGLLEGISLAILVPLLSLVGVPGTGGDLLSSLVARAFDATGVPLRLGTLLALFVVLQTVTVGITWFLERTAAKVQQSAVSRWRQAVAHAVEAAPWSAHVRIRPARIAQGLVSDPERVGVAVLMLLRNGAALVLLAVYLGLALRTDWPTTLAVAAAGFGLLVALRPWSLRAARQGQELVAAIGDVHGATHHWLTGMKLVKLHGGHGAAVTAAIDRVSRSQRKAAAQQATSQWILRLSAAVLLALAVAFAAPRLPPANLLFLLFLFARTLPRLAELQRNHQNYRHAEPAHANLQALVAELRSQPEPEPAREAPRLRQSLRIQSAVVDHGRERVGPIDLELPAGRRHTLTGPSGSGKTTTLDLAAGLLEPTSGEVLVDGVILDGPRRVAWRGRVGYLPQEPFLLDGTVRDNLRWAAPAATAADIEWALRAAACDFALGDGGVDMQVGDQGRRLSGGQRRRVALAMALARRPDLLVLDEPYAGLDPETAARVRQALDGLEGMTVLVAEHRDAVQGR